MDRLGPVGMLLVSIIIFFQMFCQHYEILHEIVDLVALETTGHLATVDLLEVLLQTASSGAEENCFLRGMGSPAHFSSPLLTLISGWHHGCII